MNQTDRTQDTDYTEGEVVLYQGRLYHIGSCKLGLIAGPHFRLLAIGDYPSMSLTSYMLLSRPKEGK